MVGPRSPGLMRFLRRCGALHADRAREINRVVPIDERLSIPKQRSLPKQCCLLRCAVTPAERRLRLTPMPGVGHNQISTSNQVEATAPQRCSRERVDPAALYPVAPHACLRSSGTTTRFRTPVKGVLLVPNGATGRRRTGADQIGLTPTGEWQTRGEIAVPSSADKTAIKAIAAL